MSRPRKATPIPLGRAATWADLEQLPEDVIAEIVNGELVVQPRPNLPHTRATSDLNGLLAGPFRFGNGGPGGWILLFEPRLRFGSEIRVPDLAGWRKERWMDLPQKGPIPLVPDWICEVLSASTAADDRTVKRALYAQHRVRHLWLLDPETHTLEVYRLEERGWLLASSHGEDDRVRAEPFEAFELDLSQLWDPGPPEKEDDKEGE